jgi:hypothetical protein
MLLDNSRIVMLIISLIADIGAVMSKSINITGLSIIL